MFVLFPLSYPAFLLVLSGSKIMPDSGLSLSLIRVLLAFQLIFGLILEPTSWMCLPVMSVCVPVTLVVFMFLVVLIVLMFPQILLQVC